MMDLLSRLTAARRSATLPLPGDGGFISLELREGLAKARAFYCSIHSGKLGTDEDLPPGGILGQATAWMQSSLTRGF
jgi:hypothetical protein